jgi:rubrerythrin
MVGKKNPSAAADCIYPDCLIRTEFGAACEHSCEHQAAASRSLPVRRRVRCTDCGFHWADAPSSLCPGCQAYAGHQM